MSDFKEVPGYPGYFVSKDGVVVNRRHRWASMRFRPLSWRNIKGYAAASVTVNGKQGNLLIHRAVLLAWVGLPPSEQHQAAHEDGSRRNNNLENLRWKTPLENSRDKIKHGTHMSGDSAPTTKIKTAQIREIVERFPNEKSTDIATDYGISFQSVCEIATGKKRAQPDMAALYEKNIEAAKSKRMKLGFLKRKSPNGMPLCDLCERTATRLYPRRCDQHREKKP